MLALPNGGADHSQGRAVTSRGQRPGIAVRKHGRRVVQQRRAMTPHGLIHGDVLSQNALRFIHQAGLGSRDLFEFRRAAEERFFEHSSHPLDRPEQIHSRWTSSGNGLRNGLELGAKLGFRPCD